MKFSQATYLESLGMPVYPFQRKCKRNRVGMWGLLSVIAFTHTAVVLGSVVHWRSGSAEIAEQSRTEVVAKLTALAKTRTAESQRFVVQFDRPVRDDERATLVAGGLQLLSYVGNHTWFARIAPQRADAAQLQRVESIRAVVDIDPAWKMHPRVRENRMPEWSRVGGSEPSVAAYVLLHRDVDLHTAGRQAVSQYGARIVDTLESINGFVVELPEARVSALASDDAVLWVEPPLPHFDETNNVARYQSGATLVQEAPYNLDGSGVNVLVYDGGTARSTHEDFSGRLSVRDSAGMSYHATHVAGTIGGDGSASDGFYRGMAPGVTMQSYGFQWNGSGVFLYNNPGDLESDYTEAINVYGAVISNNSIGTNTALHWDCEITGDYGITSHLIDSIVRGSVSGGQSFRIVWAGGNERQVLRCGNHYYTTAPPSGAKNHIAVGAIYSNNGLVTDFSSWGPVDDGRIRPDIVAPGCQSNGDMGVTSCDSGTDTGYRSLCGTSMAAPTVTGICALIIEDFRQQYPTQPDLRNSMLKAILLHTAEDAGEEGPDYQYGFGRVAADVAVDLVRAGHFNENALSQGQVATYQIEVFAGEPTLKVTMVWDDYPATPNTSAALMNDLDLRVYDPSGVRHYPWTLDPANPDAPAVRNQEDHINNVEQVLVDDPVSGMWTVEVHGTAVPYGPQVFSVCASPRFGAGDYADCNGNGIVDHVDLLDGTSLDCNNNDIPDECDIADGTSDDCNANGTPDDCEPGHDQDCNENGVPDLCDLHDGTAADCNNNNVPDSCEAADGADCNGNGIPDECDIDAGTSPDCNGNGVPDECDVAMGNDCNINGVPDECDIASGTANDCNTNGVPDECDIANGTSSDLNGDGNPDECEATDCNGNGIVDAQDIADGTSEDCDRDGVPDECEHIGRRGIVGTYFTYLDFLGQRKGRLDDQIDFDWGAGGPWDDGIVDTFSVRWTGRLLTPDVDGTYTFTTRTDDGVRLWIDGQLLIDQWIDQAETAWSASIDLEADTLYRFKMEYYENGGQASASLSWSYPGQGEIIVPMANLVPGIDCDDNGSPDSCQPDYDDDGTADNCDDCPLDPEKVVPGACGCGVPDIDSDGDGTFDCNDGCPDDPDKAEPGACGCGVPETDSDNDGVPDCVDGCPYDPSKLEPGVCDCGTPDTDSDGDGTLDCNDGCPLDPDKIEPGECGCGLPDTDSDGDSVPDCLDECPGFDDFADCDGDGIPDGCDGPDCNENHVTDSCDLASGFSIDCNGNAVPDECDIWAGTSTDSNGDGIPDECQSVPGDLNCDGSVTFEDINPFVLALSSQSGYEDAHPDCVWLNGDMDGDGEVTFSDINPFVAVLSGGS